MALPFEDDFESGDTTGWATVDGTVDVAAGYAIHDSYGARVAIDSSNTTRTNNPYNETEFYSRMYIDTSPITSFSSAGIRIMAVRTNGWASVCLVELVDGGATDYGIKISASLDSGSSDSSVYDISDGEHCIEIEWNASTGAGNDDGSMLLYIDGTLKETLEDLDNDTLLAGIVDCGAMWGWGTRTGYLYYDDVEIVNDGYIGLLGSPSSSESPSISPSSSVSASESPSQSPSSSESPSISPSSSVSPSESPSTSPSSSESPSVSPSSSISPSSSESPSQSPSSSQSPSESPSISPSSSESPSVSPSSSISPSSSESASVSPSSSESSSISPSSPPAPNIIDYYDEASPNSARTMRGGSTIKHAQSFTGNGEQLKSASFKLYKDGSPTGNATIVLYAHDGTYGSDSEATGTALATSETLDVSTITGTDIGTSDYYELDFDTPYVTTDGTYYVLSIEFEGGSSGNELGVVGQTSSPAHDGNASYYKSSWTTESGRDVLFYAYYDQSSPSASISPSSSESPSPSPSSSESPSVSPSSSISPSSSESPSQSPSSSESPSISPSSSESPSVSSSESPSISPSSSESSSESPSKSVSLSPSSSESPSLSPSSSESPSPSASESSSESSSVSPSSSTSSSESPSQSPSSSESPSQSSSQSSSESPSESQSPSPENNIIGSTIYGRVRVL